MPARYSSPVYASPYFPYRGINPEVIYDCLQYLHSYLTCSSHCYDCSDPKTYFVPTVFRINCSGISFAKAVIASNPVQCMGTI